MLMPNFDPWNFVMRGTTYGNWYLVYISISFIFCISQGSVVTYLRCREFIVYGCCWKFAAESNSERILEIGQHLPKLRMPPMTTAAFFVRLDRTAYYLRESSWVQRPVIFAVVSQSVWSSVNGHPARRWSYADRRSRLRPSGTAEICRAADSACVQVRRAFRRPAAHLPRPPSASSWSVSGDASTSTSTAGCAPWSCRLSTSCPPPDILHAHIIHSTGSGRITVGPEWAWPTWKTWRPPRNMCFKTVQGGP